MVAESSACYFHQASDLLEQPERAPGWTFADPVVLGAWAGARAMVPPDARGGAPELAEISRFLDVGTGVGWLAVARRACGPRPRSSASTSGNPALERARTNVQGTPGLDDRIALRKQDVARELDEVDTFVFAWVPTFFMPEARPGEGAAELGCRALSAAGGWIVARA